MDEGKEYDSDVEITELSRRGEGIAKVQGFVIFVKGAKVGQNVKINVDRVGRRFASALLGTSDVAWFNKSLNTSGRANSPGQANLLIALNLCDRMRGIYGIFLWLIYSTKLQLSPQVCLLLKS